MLGGKIGERIYVRERRYALRDTRHVMELKGRVKDLPVPTALSMATCALKQKRARYVCVQSGKKIGVIFQGLERNDTG